MTAFIITMLVLNSLSTIGNFGQAIVKAQNNQKFGEHIFGMVVGLAVVAWAIVLLAS